MIDFAALRAEFIGLHDEYLKAHERMLELQEKAIHGMRIIGTGCINEENEAEFDALKEKIDRLLGRMREICKTLISEAHAQ